MDIEKLLKEVDGELEKEREVKAKAQIRAKKRDIALLTQALASATKELEVLVESLKDV